MKATKEQIYGWIGSVMFGGLLLLLLLLTVIKTIIPDQEEGGVLVNFGNIDEAAGTFEPFGTTDPQITASSTPSSQAPSVEDLVTQRHEESVALTEAQRKEAERRAEEEKNRRAEEQRRQNISNQVSGAFGAASSSPQSNSQGTGRGTGNQGSPQGNSDQGANTGVGGYGSFALNGRSLGAEGLPRPAYAVQEGGSIVIDITVNSNGNVIEAKIGKGTNIDNLSMRNSAIEAAKKAKFNRIEGSNNQYGTITYRYELK